MKVLNETQLEVAKTILESKNGRLSSLLSPEIKNLAIAWSYYSSKIEGNTYTFVETECLLKDGFTAIHKYEDAKMMKNLYNTFISELWHINKLRRKAIIDKQTLLRLHSQLMADLLPNERRGVLRDHSVAITATTYQPSSNPEFISHKLDEILAKQYDFSNPIERAIYLHCNIARLQPFSDGNKRMSRLVESLVLMNADLVPTYSCEDTDFIKYRSAIIHFYETEDYQPYADFVLEKQIRNLQKMAPKLKQDELIKRENGTSAMYDKINKNKRGEA